MDAVDQLRIALRANATFSIATGLFGVVAAGRVVDILGTGNELLVRLIAIGLLGFAGFVLYVSTRSVDELRAEALLISAGDFVWVLASVVLIALGLFSTGGAVTAGLIALVVLGFASSQLWARSKSATA